MSTLPQITEKWLNIAASDLDTGQAMLAGGRYLWAGFMAQQCAEKALKAVIEENQGRPPKAHSLEALAKKAGLGVNLS